MQPRRRAPLLTAPPEDLRTQQTVSRDPVAYRGLPTASSSTDFPELSSKPKAMAITGEGEIGPLQRNTSQFHEANVGNLCKERHATGQSTSRSSCRRVGLGRVELGYTRDFRNGQKAISQIGQQLRKKSNGYRPPTAPEFAANSSSGDVSIAFIIIYNSSNKFSLLKGNTILSLFVSAIIQRPLSKLAGAVRS